MARRAGRCRLCRLRRGQRQLQPLSRAGDGICGGGQPGLLRRGLRGRPVDVGRRAKGRGGLQERQGAWLARAQHMPVPRHRAVLPPWLQRPPDGDMDPGARRRRGQAAAGGERRRCRLRTRLLHHSDGSGLSKITLLRLRLPRAVHRAGARSGRASRRRRPHRLRTRLGQGLSGGEIRSRDDVRLPARHGRSGRGGPACQGGARGGWKLDDRRALRVRQPEGEPQPRGAHLLRRLDDDLHAGFAVAGGRARSRRPGWRDALAQGGARCRPDFRISTGRPKRPSTWCSRSSPSPSPCLCRRRRRRSRQRRGLAARPARGKKSFAPRRRCSRKRGCRFAVIRDSSASS